MFSGLDGKLEGTYFEILRKVFLIGKQLNLALKERSKKRDFMGFFLRRVRPPCFTPSDFCIIASVCNIIFEFKILFEVRIYILVV